MSLKLDDLGNQQKSCIGKVLDWHSDKDRQNERFDICGYAGTGKTTIVSFTINELNRIMADEFKAKTKLTSTSSGLFSNVAQIAPKLRVAFITFTAQAAAVLRKKGIPAQTIHSLIYKAIKDSKGNVTFVLRSVKEVAGSLDMIVVDEVGMVNDEMLKKIEHFGVRVITLGDNAQLDPIEGKCSALDNPHFMLTEIHRTAADSPIVQVATLARQGKFINFGKYGNDVIKVDFDKLSDSTLSRVDQVIVGRRKTKDDLNHIIRRAKGFTSHLPEKGDRLICVKNNHQKGLYNGLHGVCLDTVQESDLNIEGQSMLLNFEDLDGNDHFDLRCRLNIFEDFETKIDKRKEWAMEAFEFAYAQTCHKLQGSSAPNVLVCEFDTFGDANARRKWLYTALTRAEKKLIIAA